MAANLNKLIAQRKALDARIAKEKAKAKQKKRKDETRRKILVGAVVLKHMEHDTSFKHNIEHLLNTQLVKTIDRDLFGLAPREDTPVTSDSVEPEVRHDNYSNPTPTPTHQG